MDSLLANYASSDEEEHPPSQLILSEKPVKLIAKTEEEKDRDFPSNPPSKRGGIFNSLPPPKSPLFNSPPPLKSQSFPIPKPQAEFELRREDGKNDEQILENSKPKSASSSSLFSSIPPPKTSSSSSAKRVVQFRPPTMINTYSGSVDDEDEDSDEDEKERKMKRSKESISTTSATSFLSSIPAPRHSAAFGALPSASGMGRRSTLETFTPASTASIDSTIGSDAVVDSNAGHSKDQSGEIDYDYSSWNSGSENHAYYSGYGAVPDDNVGSAVVSSFGGENHAYYGGYGVGSADVSSVSTAGSDSGLNYNAGSSEAVDYSYGNGQHVEYTNYDGRHGDYGNDVQYENNWANATALPEVSGGNELLVPGKRGRKDAPPQMVEVKQDELMKNRPREDQVKMTGIAFGPAHQPTSTKGKPSKLHKRKHQIGALLFDMRQKEMELSERRAKGFLTKAQTQAKYGW